MTRALLLTIIGVLCACGDNHVAAADDAMNPADGGGQIDGATIDALADGAAADGAVDARPALRTGCLDQPTDLPRPPTGEFPCDLIPPGVAF